MDADYFFIFSVWSCSVSGPIFSNSSPESCPSHAATFHLGIMIFLFVLSSEQRPELTTIQDCFIAVCAASRCCLLSFSASWSLSCILSFPFAARALLFRLISFFHHNLSLLSFFHFIVFSSTLLLSLLSFTSLVRIYVLSVFSCTLSHLPFFSSAFPRFLLLPHPLFCNRFFAGFVGGADKAWETRGRIQR